MTVGSNIDMVNARLQERIKASHPNSPEVRAALTRIGILISSNTKLNIRAKRIVDQGRLLNSIGYELYTNGEVSGVRVGSFGVPYAAINEYGGPFTDRMRRAMFASLGKRNMIKKGHSKGIIKNGIYRARPYLGPAVKKQTSLVLDILREVLASE